MPQKFFGRDDPFDPGAPFSEEEPFGFPSQGKRFFRRGDLKYALLELLEMRPMHGYEMMKALQEQTSGMYTPSPGSIYPTLQMLEGRGCVTVSDISGKKVYSMTDAGRTFLAQARPEERVDSGRRQPWHIPKKEWAELEGFWPWQEVHEITTLLDRALQRGRGDPEKLKRLHRLLEQVHLKLIEIAAEADK